MSFWGSVTVNEIEIFSFSSKDCDDKPSIIGFPSFSTSRIVIDNSSEIESVPSDASTDMSYWLSVFESFGFSKSGLVLNVIWPDVDIDNLSASLPDREKPIGSFSISSTDTVNTTRVFSSILDVDTKSVKVGTSFTDAISIFTDAVEEDPSTFTL